MPIYEYECTKCGKIEEVLQKFSDRPLTKCKHCSGNLHKLISQSTFHLKGSGWYVTDYAKKNNLTPTSKKKKDKKPADSKDISKKSTKESSK